VIVLDAVGLTTLDYLLDKFPGKVFFPNLSRLGLGKLVAPRHCARLGPVEDGAYAMAVNQASATADSPIGHREMMGVVDPRVYSLFPNGFPPEYLTELERRIVALEAAQRVRTEQLGDAAVFADPAKGAEISRAFSRDQRVLEELNRRWAEVGEELDRMRATLESDTGSE